MNREEHLEQLKSETFDVLVIGGGATGTGVALDAATRGLKVALVERDDFSAGTSSRSTKLIHGGVRYLEQAVKKFDRSQFNLVRDALKERAVLINIAPHLAKPIPLVTPLYNWLEVPYYMTGLKLYDGLAGKANLRASRFVDAKEALDRFPMLNPEGLRGGVIYYDGQFDDARMNISIALTAAQQGAVLANHVEVTELHKQGGKLTGASVKDTLSGDSFSIRAKVLVNATGPFSDTIRHLDDPGATPMLSASSGAHIILDSRFSPPETGLLIPETEDGRVLFLLPWLGHTLVGTTDNPASIEANPKATEDEIAYILRHVHKYFSIPVSREDVKAAWSGLRPLVSDPGAADTAKLSRDHVINTSTSGLITIAGGKWTTYRKMALDTVDEVERVGQFAHNTSLTEHLKLVGGKQFSPHGAGKLQEDYGLELDTASYLNRAYGDQAAKVAELVKLGYSERLAKNHAYLTAEVIYSARHEAARSSVDILARRTRLAFLDAEATRKAVPVVANLLAQELGWSDRQKSDDISQAETYFSAS
ncbi:MAG: FAD-dependent oxidoreductase [Trueperaceae bacterium]|nr:FAD-dependent oxidoreductase [Trueperaceae bacterium]